jgi:hypothetical protein
MHIRFFQMNNHQLFHRFLVVLFILFHGTICTAQNHKFTKEETERMKMAYAFYLIQQNSIEAISLRFPNLATLANDALSAWNKRFLVSIIKIDTALTNDLQQDWVINKSMMNRKYSNGDYSRITETAAKQFIYEVNYRAIGKIQSPVLETLLIFNPIYQKDPIKEYEEGYTESFYSKKSKKAFGLDILIKYPKSWKTVSVNKKPDNQVQFVSAYGTGNVSLTLTIERMKATVDSKKALSKENLLPGKMNSEDVLSYKPDYSMDNCPAANITFYHEDKKQGQILGFLNVVYALTYQNNLIKLSFTYTSPSGKEEDILHVYEKYKELEVKIKNSLVILSQYGQKK